MTKKYTFVFTCLLTIASATQILGTTNINNKTSFSGKVADKATKEPLVGVTVYLPDLKTGTLTDINGYFKLEGLPKTKILVQLSYLGYKTLVQTIDLSDTSSMNFNMEYTATELNEVVITGLSKASEQKRMPTPISIVPKTELLQNASSNIIDAIANQPGISQITTGSGISKPVIRGLGYNRVVVINDGIRQEGQQWGDEHGIEIDDYAVNRIEILKGPASVAYGSDAMAGVVNMLSAPTLAEGKIEGNIQSNYQTNNGLIGTSANTAGNQNGFIWDVRYSNKLAHSYRNKYDGYVFNSGFSEEAFETMLGLNKWWGYSHITLSVFNLKPSITEGERDSLTGRFTKPLSEESSAITNDQDLKSYKSFVPYQQIHHYKVVSDNNIIFGKSNIKLILGLQQNQRQEYADITNPSAYGLYFLMNTINYDVKYNLPEINNWNFSAGINGMLQDSKNKGSEFLVPDYNLSEIGGFIIAKKSLGKVDLSGGVRYDTRRETGKSHQIIQADTLYTLFNQFKSTFSDFSGSVGFTYQITDKIYSKFNISSGFRAPNIAELASNGVHEGTIRYEIGNPDLKAEHSLQFDYALGFNTEHISTELNLYRNDISDYIFSTKLQSYKGNDSIREDYNTFKFISGNAALYGGEFRFDFHPHPFDWIHFENSFSYVNAQLKGQPDSSKYLPFTPAPKYQSGLKFDVKEIGTTLKNFYFKIGADYYFAQNNIYNAFHTETATPEYLLLNAGFGSEIVKSGKTICSIFISVNNITDISYQNHLSRLKYAPDNYHTNRKGIFNMGRNFSFKIEVPLSFKN